MINHHRRVKVHPDRVFDPWDPQVLRKDMYLTTHLLIIMGENM